LESSDQGDNKQPEIELIQSTAQDLSAPENTLDASFSADTWNTASERSRDIDTNVQAHRVAKDDPQEEDPSVQSFVYAWNEVQQEQARHDLGDTPPLTTKLL
jgi:hypothetical protein